MIWLRSFLRDQRATTAAEFGLLLPLITLFLVGIIAAGQLAWEVNKAERATQIGARWAAATDMVPSALQTWSFATSVNQIPQGTIVPIANFPGVSCTSSGGTATCSCKSGGTCSFATTANNAAFNAIVARMAQFDASVTADRVTVDYDWSGLGFSGDPNGPDVAPIITVRLSGLPFTPITNRLFGANFTLPSFEYSMTMEDGSGTFSN